MARHNSHDTPSCSWDRVADWYTGWVGPDGSDYHRRLAIPAVLDLLQPRPTDRIVDLGCGPGVLAPHLAAAGARYTGVDKSRRLIDYARRHHSSRGTFLTGDVARIAEHGNLTGAPFDAAVFLLSIQDISPLGAAMAGAARLLRAGGRLVIVMTHPCFRIPRQSGWGWDPRRKLQFRRIDRYLTPLAVPMKQYAGRRGGATRSYHRPLQAYFDELNSAGLFVQRLREIPDHGRRRPGPRTNAERHADEEIPLLLGLRAVKG